MKRFDLNSGHITAIGALLLLVVVCLGVLWGTESSYANRLAMLGEVEAALVGEGLSGQRVVHLTGEAEVDRPIEDRELGLTVDALFLERSVEMYQWTRHTDSENRTTYRQEWRSSPVDSSRFRQGRRNPGGFPIQASSYPGPGARIGDLHLQTTLIRELPQEEYSPQPQEVDLSILSEYRQASDRERQVYLRGTPTQPRVGDLRITYRYIPLQEVSVLAAAEPGMAVPIQTSTGTFSMILPGRHTAEQMLARARAEIRSSALLWRTLLLTISVILAFIVATILSSRDSRALSNTTNHLLTALFTWVLLAGVAFGAAHTPAQEGIIAISVSGLAGLALLLLYVLSARRTKKFGDF